MISRSYLKDFMQQDKQYIIAMEIQMFWHFQRKAGTAYEKENIISDIGGGTLYINAFIYGNRQRELCAECR